MKKLLLLTLCFLPISISCNRGTYLGFDNPFPNDEYLTKRIGFNLSNDETPVRPLTTDEINAVSTTMKGDFDCYVTKYHTVRHYRSYIRAFAGNFKQGYDANNQMVDEDNKLFRQEYPDSSNDDLPQTKRTINIKKTLKNVNDYSYGRIDDNSEIKTYRYLFDANEGTSGGEAKEYKTTGLTIHDRIQTKKNDNIVVEDKLIGEPSKGWPEKSNLNHLVEMQIPQSHLLSSPDGSDCGADANGKIILVKKEQHPYKAEEAGAKEGVFKLKDGREYRAVNRSITVAKVVLEKKSSIYFDDWVLVSSARTYSEVVITSDVIHPNVPITDLKNPIVITFEETMYDSFSTDPVTDHTEELPKLEERL